jgi:hypothetical protein
MSRRVSIAAVVFARCTHSRLLLIRFAATDEDMNMQISKYSR